MADRPFRLERVITLPAGSLLQYGNGSRESFYFYDANHNLKLDPADKKIVQKELEKNQFEFENLRLKKAEALRFGEEAEKALQQVRRERNELRKLLPSAKAGQCFAPSEGNQRAALGEKGVEFLFSPALTLRTPRADSEKFYSLLDLMNWKKGKPLDPSRCFVARGTAIREEVADLKISSKEIEILTGDLLTPTVLQALGLENGDRLDAAYQIVQGAKRVHIDLTPSDA